MLSVQLARLPHGSVLMVRRRSTVRFRNGALAYTLERWRPTWADQMGRHLCVVRLATAHTDSHRLAVPNTCPSLSRGLRVRSWYASLAGSAGRHSRRAPFGMWANGHPRYVHAGAGMLAVAAGVGADDFPRCRHGRWRRGPTCGTQVTALWLATCRPSWPPGVTPNRGDLYALHA